MAADTSIASGVAGRYASALFDLANEADALDAINEDLQALKTLIRENEDLATLVSSPLYSREEQAGAITAILEKAGAANLTVRFVGVVADNHRLFAVVDMIDAYRALLARHRGEVTAEVVSAHPLNEGQNDALREALSASLRSDVNVEASVDESLLGGLVVRVGSRMIDSSLRTKLDNLQLAMKGVG